MIVHCIIEIELREQEERPFYHLINIPIPNPEALPNSISLINGYANIYREKSIIESLKEGKIIYLGMVTEDSSLKLISKVLLSKDEKQLVTEENVVIEKIWEELKSE